MLPPQTLSRPFVEIFFIPRHCLVQRWGECRRSRSAPSWQVGRHLRKIRENTADDGDVKFDSSQSSQPRTPLCNVWIDVVSTSSRDFVGEGSGGRVRPLMSAHESFFPSSNPSVRSVRSRHRTGGDPEYCLRDSPDDPAVAEPEVHGIRGI